MSAPARLLARDVVRIGTTGLRTRPTRAILSALGIAIGIAAMIAVVGISASSQARLNDELDRLGTNLLRATAGTSLAGQQTTLPQDAALIGEPVATRLFAFDGSPTVVYERSADEAVERVRSLLGPTVSPQAPSEVEVSRPSDALAAKNAANQAFTGLLVGLGSVALLVGGIGVANTMIISVLERRREIGLRRSLGATRRHIRTQFLTEALLLSALGGVFGCGLGATVTAVMALANTWPFALPVKSLVIAVAATLAIGATAGLYPAVRAARTPPTAALNS